MILLTIFNVNSTIQIKKSSLLVAHYFIAFMLDGCEVRSHAIIPSHLYPLRSFDLARVRIVLSIQSVPLGTTSA